MWSSSVIPVVLAFLLVPFAGSGAEIHGSWDALAGTIQSGSKISVTRMNSASLEGKFVSIDAESITLWASGKNQTIARKDVYRIRALKGHPVLFGTLIGAAVGAVGLWGADRASDKPRAGEAVGLGIVFGAGGGAIVGAVLPRGPILYEAERPNNKRTP